MRTTVIVTALGPDSHGLLAQVATTIAEQNANVDDVSQTVANGMFTMIMFVSFDQGETTIADLKEALEVDGQHGSGCRSACSTRTSSSSCTAI